MRKLLLLLTLLLSLSASASSYFFKTLDARDGLTSSQVTCILKDSRGFMWFGTPAGLYRYDGYIFKHFQSDSQDGSSLPDSYIQSIQEAIDGSLWVKTPAGYCIYHPQTETFERDMRQVFANMGISNVPKIAYIDSHHNVWCYQPSTGVICYNMQKQMLFEFAYTGTTRGVNGIPQGEICSISECKEGAVFVYSNGMIVCCDVMSRFNVQWMNNEVAQKQLRNSKTLKACADKNDNIWLYGQGTLFIYNKKAKTWNTSFGNQLGMTGVGVDYTVNSISCDKSGSIWIATSRNGLIKVNAKTLEMEDVQLNTMMPSRLQTISNIQSVYVDDTDLLWVGTAKSGVAFWGTNIYKFTASMNGDITAICEDKEGNFIYGTGDHGIIGYDGPLASLKVTAMARTSDGSLWVGSQQNGLTRIKDGKTRIYSTVSDSVRKTLIDDHIHALCTDKSGNLWIATEGGLQMFNIKLETFSNYTKENNKLKVNNTTALYYCNDNTMLIGTAEGLTILNITNGEVNHYTGTSNKLKKFTNNYITCLFKDSENLIWIGTREGLNILNLENDNLDIITEKQQLCNNNICGIAEGSNHNIWISTSNGVSRIVIQRNHENGTYDYGLYNYSHSDGLQSNEFNMGSIYTTEKGRTVIMGGLYGVNFTSDNTHAVIIELPRVMLTQMFIGEEEILPGHTYDGRVILNQTLNESNSITLSSDQNTFTIKFAAGDYNQSERLQFKYWMEGLDFDWRNGDAMNHGVTFTDLKSNTYKLHVKAVSAEGAVSNQERIIEIKIESPWYLQIWMLAFYAALIVIIVYAWRVGLRKLRVIWKKKKELLSELAIQREEIKLASDDLRQPMARMTSIIMNLAERDSMLEEREQLNALHSQMLQIITRVSDMQMSLEHPEEHALQQVNKHFELNSQGEMNLPDAVSEELTSEIRSQYRESPTSKFRVMFIDDNEEFIRFVDARLRYVYEFHSYNDIVKAASEVESSMPDLIICEHNMHPMTGSEFCNRIKTNPTLDKIKFVLILEGKMSDQELTEQAVTLSADDYLEKPFNLQEAAMRFNKLLGIGAFDITNNLIEGAETRMLEGRNSSMTTATETMECGNYDANYHDDQPDEEMRALEVQFIRDDTGQSNDKTEFSEYSTLNVVDRQLIANIEQYVQQNMSRGQINLEEMANTMGMGMRPFFMKIRDITGKTPTEVVKDMKLKHACMLLKRTNINMSELATNVGFATGESFINTFKERFGISPSEYRQKYRK
jgi:ligand-binding sensor domain-containing protein/AraC-like DNA-binding protein/DNA-binding response OmpR family regulator